MMNFSNAQTTHLINVPGLPPPQVFVEQNIESYVWPNLIAFAVALSAVTAFWMIFDRK